MVIYHPNVIRIFIERDISWSDGSDGWTGLWDYGKTFTTVIRVFQMLMRDQVKNWG